MEHLVGELVSIPFIKIDSNNISINDHLGANYTWSRGTIQGSALNGYSVAGSLNNDILFRMQAAT